MQTTIAKLTGPELITHTENSLRAGLSRTDLIIRAGYTKIKPDHTIGAAYVDFYEALLAAKMAANPELYASENTEPEESYDDLPEETKALYDHLSETIGEKWTHSEQLEFVSLLASDLGIEELEQFQDAFYSMVENQWTAEAEFAEELVTELEYSLKDSIAYAAIDWQKVWDHQLRYDFDTLEFDGCTYFFRNI